MTRKYSLRERERERQRSGEEITRGEGDIVATKDIL